MKNGRYLVKALLFSSVSVRVSSVPLHGPELCDRNVCLTDGFDPGENVFATYMSD